MSDEEMAKYLGFDADEMGLRCVHALEPAKRKLFERMADLEVEVNLYSQGLGPKPQGVLLDFDKRAKR